MHRRLRCWLRAGKWRCCRDRPSHGWQGRQGADFALPGKALRQGEFKALSKYPEQADRQATEFTLVKSHYFESGMS